MHIGYTPPETRHRAAAQVRVFCREAEVLAPPVPGPTQVRVSWNPCSRVWRLVARLRARQAPANDS